MARAKKVVAKKGVSLWDRVRKLARAPGARAVVVFALDQKPDGSWGVVNWQGSARGDEQDGQWSAIQKAIALAAKAESHKEKLDGTAGATIEAAAGKFVDEVIAQGTRRLADFLGGGKPG
jgi:hypothetical protein